MSFKQSVYSKPIRIEAYSEEFFLQNSTQNEYIPLTLNDILTKLFDVIRVNVKYDNRYFAIFLWVWLNVQQRGGSRVKPHCTNQ